jgi:MFS transporter, ACS family, D-galactonate transporter
MGDLSNHGDAGASSAGWLGPGHPNQADLAKMNRVVFLLGLSVFINYIDRSNLSIAAPLLKDELGLSAVQLGTLLSAFFWTYGLMQVPAGWLVDHFDVKWVFAAGFFVWSLATAITGTLHGFAALIIIRVILGVGESVAFPCCCKVLSTYVTERSRGFMNAVLMAGLSLGPAVGILVGGTVVGHFGWRPFFLGLGIGGLLWLGPWFLWMPRRVSRSREPSSQGIGILPILRCRSAWGTCVGQFSINYYLYFLVTWLPFYLVRSRHLSLEDMAKVGGLVFLMSAIAALIWGKLTDGWIHAGATPTLVRKGSMVLGHVGVGIFLILAAIEKGPAFVGMLALTGTFLGISVSNGWAITQTLAGPLAAGRWTGVQNFIGNLAGWVAPYLTGQLVERTGNFYAPFFITAIVAWIGAVSWGVGVGALQQVNWGRLKAPEILAAPADPAINP